MQNTKAAAKIEPCEIIHFPVHERMPTRIAEEKIGCPTVFRFPPSIERSGWPEWLENWILKKYTLIGWASLKEGIVKGFKTGRVRHAISAVRIKSGRPFIEIACGLAEYPVWNWESDHRISSSPAILLNESQKGYFRCCARCEDQGATTVSNLREDEDY